MNFVNVMSVALLRVGSLLVLAACSAHAGNNRRDEAPAGRQPAIFRTVHFEGIDVTLGQPLQNKSALGAAIGDTAVRLDKARFGGAQNITISLAPGDTVRAMTYDYGVDTAFDARVADYEKVLGPPAVRWGLGTPDARQGEAVEWADSLTHFELRWMRRDGAVVSQSELLDRRLAQRQAATVRHGAEAVGDR